MAGDWIVKFFAPTSAIEARARHGYFVNQAKIRAAIAVPICLAFLLVYLQPSFASDPKRATVLVGSSVIALYAIVALIFSRTNDRVTWQAHLTTIVLDNAAITACVGLTGAAGEILVWLFLFITLGNGFRFGAAFLHACQVTSLVGLGVVLAISEHWQSTLSTWTGALLTMLVVPAYANGLLRKLQAAIRKAEDASKAKSLFLARMSHELRTPLNGMLAAADLLRETKLTQEQQQLANIVGQAGRVLLDEIRDILDISKIEANEIHLESAPVRLSEIIEAVHTVLSQAAASKSLRFVCKFDEASTHTVLGDPYHLRQVVMNLAGNAIKFTEQGAVTLEVRTLEESAATLTFEVSVTDSGVGIPDEKLPQIFEPFRQADESTTRKYGGTGLGLSISRQLVRLMGGEITVRSNPGTGSRFSFVLAMSRAPDGPAAQLNVRGDRSRDHEVATSEPSLAKLAGQRILVADDNATNREVMRLMLEKDGHEVVLAEDGEEALKLLYEGRFAIAVLDHNMPKLSGLDALRLYRASSVDPTPVIVASADATTEAIQSSLDAGAFEHLCKPVTLDTLRDALRRGCRVEGIAANEPRTESGPRLVTSVTPNDANLIDVATLNARVNLSPDPKFAVRLIEGYISDSEILTETIHEAVELRDIDRLRDAAHALKGGSATIGATGLLELSKRLQAMNDQLLLSQGTEVLIELNRLQAATKVALRDFLSTRVTVELVAHS
jgi:two-component system sensor histidine kinase RpfC